MRCGGARPCVAVRGGVPREESPCRTWRKRQKTCPDPVPMLPKPGGALKPSDALLRGERVQIIAPAKMGKLGTVVDVEPQGKVLVKLEGSGSHFVFLRSELIRAQPGKHPSRTIVSKRISLGDRLRYWRDTHLATTSKQVCVLVAVGIMQIVVFGALLLAVRGQNEVLLKAAANRADSSWVGAELLWVGWLFFERSRGDDHLPGRC